MPDDFGTIVDGEGDPDSGSEVDSAGRWSRRVALYALPRRRVSPAEVLPPSLTGRGAGHIFRPAVPLGWTGNHAGTAYAQDSVIGARARQAGVELDEDGLWHAHEADSRRIDKAGRAVRSGLSKAAEKAKALGARAGEAKLFKRVEANTMALDGPRGRRCLAVGSERSLSATPSRRARCAVTARGGSAAHRATARRGDRNFNRPQRSICGAYRITITIGRRCGKRERGSDLLRGGSSGGIQSGGIDMIIYRRAQRQPRRHR